MIRAVLFDLDGVITDTAPLHFNAWRTIANEFGKDIDEEFNEQLKGVDRAESLRRMLNHIDVTVTEDEFSEIMSKKNENYVKSLESLSQKDILPGILQLMIDLHLEGKKIIIASASKNAPYILEKLKLLEYVDDIADPSEVDAGKPAPDIFLLAAKLAGVDKSEAVGIEDSQAGIDALNSAAIRSIGIGNYLNDATKTLSSTSELDINIINEFN